MKKIVLLIIGFTLLTNIVYPQDTIKEFHTLKYEIFQDFDKKDYYGVIKKSDKLILDHPNDEQLYYNRGIAKLSLNDYYAALEDLNQATKLGSKYNRNYIKFLTSKSYVADVYTKYYSDGCSVSEENGFKPIFGLKDSLQGALRHERTCFDVYYYDLTVKVIPNKKRIEGSNIIHFKTVEKTSKIQIDLSDKFEIESIIWNGKELEYSRVYNAIFISFDEDLPINEKQSIAITYSGSPRKAPHPPWNGGFIWGKKRFNHWVGVACEHLGASSWWPCKDHLTEKPDSMSINIQVPSKYEAIANGNLRSKSAIGDKYTNFEWFVSYPINSYCVTFYMGKFVNFSEVYTNANGFYDIDYYVLPHHLELAKEYYSQTKEIVEVYEKLYGEYPYKEDGIAMIEAPYEGMEHQSAIAIGDGYGKEKRDGYEDTDYDYLVVHELAHEWWGNTVTMGDMADAWISEGFATYSEYLFIEEKYGYAEYIKANAMNMDYVMNIWPMVGIKDVNDNSFWGGDIYHKGAAMLNNLRCIINNDSVFFLLIKDFYQQNKFKTLTSSDFTEFVNEYTGDDYNDFFDKFLYDTEPPVLHYNFTLENGDLLFSYKWINVGDGFKMPFSITINNNYNLRLIATTDPKTAKIENVKSFYLPNEKRYEKDNIKRNSFTYFWTSWER